ncbi:DUF2911 domain-containing protein [Gaopeijia maritima]|uniref:DUF2911 domain-containing protein n=1 Tax=Gaopeijia maritima TaxID=3119007 RepID=UPI003252AA8A
MTSLVRTSLAVAALLAAGPVSGQAIQASQSATVSQWIADAHFEITYDRPVARDREIWGALVPWNEVWTPSANLALQLRVNRGVLLAGQTLPAGAYSVWLEPKAGGAWRLLVHRDLEVAHNVVPSDGWVLEAAIEPRRDADHMEALAAYFSDADYREGALDLHWGTTALRIPIEVPEGG